MGDAAATLTRSLPWLDTIRAADYPAAFVAQDGLTVASTPWDAFDVLFLGGSTSWKLGPEARTLAAHARALGKRVHCGRINSWKRLAYAEIGCTSADGTYLTFGPEITTFPSCSAGSTASPPASSCPCPAPPPTSPQPPP